MSDGLATSRTSFQAMAQSLWDLVEEARKALLFAKTDETRAVANEQVKLLGGFLKILDQLIALERRSGADPATTFDTLSARDELRARIKKLDGRLAQNTGARSRAAD